MEGFTLFARTVLSMGAQVSIAYWAGYNRAKNKFQKREWKLIADIEISNIDNSHMFIGGGGLKGYCESLKWEIKEDEYKSSPFKHPDWKKKHYILYLLEEEMRRRAEG